ncbi:hypothetical protein [Microbacterium immunditiarum]|uniref:Uncharacterized protein n=1 Tax=Microbacterium immunditiarum TaxID=337480 RepID=A0A7Y9KKA6_9MICO|nr:hypothetical protein [Microbacterium immunditiarum]NYE20526.1 hypothetical protein [Microbacterium immunditiarum]
MTNYRYFDADLIGRTPARRRGLDALIPTSPDPAPDAPDAVRQLQWRELEAALFAITNAQFEYERNRDDEAGRMWIEDARRALGTLALSLADGPAAEGYARLFSTIMTEPNVRRASTDREQ